MKNFIVGLLFLCGFYACSSGKENISEVDCARYVNPFIGNADNGHTFPGACAPFGMIQASPESGNASWRYCSGFNYEDDEIFGFAQNHLNGTGCPDLGDILMLPFSGSIENNEYKARIDKSRQTARPGYYAVTLPDFGINAEVTATERTAFYRYTYQNDEEANLFIDLQSGLVTSPQGIRDRVLFADMQMPDERTIIGHNETNGWVRRHFYYVMAFDKSYKVKEMLPAREGEKAKRFVLSFDLKRGEALQVKIALSTVSVGGAKASLQKENPDWNFDKTKGETYQKWNTLLQRVRVEGTDKQKINFYTSLYHLYIQPNNIADTDGRYRGANDSVSTSPSGEYYSTLSLWDTYRAAHPLYTILAPERVNGMVSSMLAHHKVYGYLPIWTLWGKENYCMIGNHAIPVIVDAYLKGFDGFDKREAYKAIKESSTASHRNSDWEVYNKYGYYPFDIMTAESVSKTLESAYDDYCVAQMAKSLDEMGDFEYFMKRSRYYKNLFDPETKFMRGKDSKGNWRTPFHPMRLFHAGEVGGDFTEGNSWQYTWHVQQDVKGLIELLGGKDVFANKLDSLFAMEADSQEMGEVLDVTGLIGQYAHGNEPSHHVIYLYNYVNRPWRTQELVREVFDRFYLARPDGLCGNDDCGQMSAWYVFSAMGFYPVNPCGGEYVIGAPQLKEVIIDLPSQKQFTVKAINLSKTNKYIKSIMLNGEVLEGGILHHSDIMNGGLLEFIMEDHPDK
ncbi:GH92 family glycosyl hydrolase [Bacteroides faecium]|uniref:Glycoside hydrolase family 92 protein n=1 Tax=Bacteroides faecium TaxID=2715212 RepID=A0A6H0KL58_9BACE|nr:GH92 family glycosyl hydrolase [Bacteroides faecium]QIU93308.1 glycoside hydrolase family 92 protein [Bacteroides faecium]